MSKIYKKLNPDIVHNFGLRQIVHGNISAQLAGIKKTFNSIIGLGSTFISGNFFLKFFITNLLRFTLLFKNSQIFFFFLIFFCYSHLFHSFFFWKKHQKTCCMGRVK